MPLSVGPDSCSMPCNMDDKGPVNMNEVPFVPEIDPWDFPLDPAVTPDLFREWRSPRVGSTNPERMNNPVWEWLVRSRVNAYVAAQKHHGPSAMEAGPGWCFDRLGQTATQLPGGQTVFIAGEHEDFYDPDFYIYNDIVVQHPNGALDIYGYPRASFPPTDFHTATLSGNRIVIIGCLGYHEQRKPATTPVHILDLKTFTVSSIQTVGTPPGWIHKHEASLEPDGTSILIRRGLLDSGEKDASFVENINDWRLRLEDWRWERLTDRHWQAWEIARNDRQPNNLFEMEHAVWLQSFHWDKEYNEHMEALTRELGIQPDLDLFKTLHQPALAHEALPRVEEECQVTRIRVQGVVVRYVRESYSVRVMIEGELPQSVIDGLVGDLCDKLTRLENAPVNARRVL